MIDEYAQRRDSRARPQPVGESHGRHGEPEGHEVGSERHGGLHGRAAEERPNADGGRPVCALADGTSQTATRTRSSTRLPTTKGPWYRSTIMEKNEESGGRARRDRCGCPWPIARLICWAAREFFGGCEKSGRRQQCREMTVRAYCSPGSPHRGPRCRADGEDVRQPAFVKPSAESRENQP